MAQKPATSPTTTEMICLGDEVTLNDTKRGIVRFIGPMDEKMSPTFYGIELKTATGKNEGSANGKNYFKCGPNKGMFITKMKISKSKATTESKQNPRITFGSRVNVPENKCQGVVRYIGHVSFQEGVLIGVELDKPSGDNNGTVKDRFYFKCKEKHGVFVGANAIETIEEKTKVPASSKDKDTKKVSAVTTSGAARDKGTAVVISGAARDKGTAITTSGAARDKGTAVVISGAARDKGTAVITSGAARDKGTAVATSGAARDKNAAISLASENDKKTTKNTANTKKVDKNATTAKKISCSSNQRY